MLCGTCDVNYTGLSGGPPVRYGSYMGTCVPCASSARMWFALIGLFLVLFLYNAFGSACSCMHRRSASLE
jgi:hypothetical protein